MCMFSAPSMPAPPPPPPPPPDPPKKVDPEVQAARNDERSRIRAMAGRKSTIATSAQGLLTPPNSFRKKLLGQ